jgi:hypothetical protein
MTGISKCLSIITVNVNFLNSPIKRQRLMNWIRKKKKTQLFVAHKKHTSLAKTDTNLTKDEKGLNSKNYKTLKKGILED